MKKAHKHKHELAERTKQTNQVHSDNIVNICESNRHYQWAAFTIKLSFVVPFMGSWAGTAVRIIKLCSCIHPIMDGWIKIALTVVRRMLNFIVHFSIT